MCQEVLCVEIDEEQSYEYKIDTFAIYNAFHFILDCLFAFLYRLDYENNEKQTREKANTINQVKK